MGNKDVELGAEAELPPAPVLECDSACVSAIEDCLEDGCSVEAMTQLAAKLAEDAKTVQDTMSKIEQLVKMNPVPGAQEELAGLDKFLCRSGTLRAQLLALKPMDGTSLVQQIIR